MTAPEAGDTFGETGGDDWFAKAINPVADEPAEGGVNHLGKAAGKRWALCYLGGGWRGGCAEIGHIYISGSDGGCKHSGKIIDFILILDVHEGAKPGDSGSDHFADFVGVT